MATYCELRKKRARRGFRYQMELNFTSEDDKQTFLSRMVRAKERLTLSAAHRPWTTACYLAYYSDMAETMPTPPTNQPDCLTTTGDQQQTVPIRMTMLDNSGL